MMEAWSTYVEIDSVSVLKIPLPERFKAKM